MRIVSLVPAATEIIAALGAGEALVGVSHECVLPPGTELPRVTSTVVAGDAPPAEVDRAVREQHATGTPLYRVDEARIAALAPDLIITQGVCDVCAPAVADVRALAGRLRPSPTTLVLDATTLGGVLEDIARVAAAIGETSEGDELLAGLRVRMRAVHERLAAVGAPRPRVAVLEWTDPIFAAGHWVPEMVRRAGGLEVLARAGARSVVVPLDEVIASRPDVIVLAPCGYDLAAAVAEGRRIWRQSAWRWLHATRTWAVDASALVSRPGPGLVAGIETLAAILHPALFPRPAATRAVDVERA